MFNPGCKAKFDRITGITPSEPGNSVGYYFE